MLSKTLSSRHKNFWYELFFILEVFKGCFSSKIQGEFFSFEDILYLCSVYTSVLLASLAVDSHRHNLLHVGELLSIWNTTISHFCLVSEDNTREISCNLYFSIDSLEIQLGTFVNLQSYFLNNISCRTYK